MDRGALPQIDECSCGSTNVECSQVARLKWNVICKDCGEKGEAAQNAIDAIAGWNHPAPIGDFAFISSGNDQTDKEVAERFIMHSARLDDNVCPNGCAQLIRIDSNNRECPACHFVHTKF